MGCVMSEGTALDKRKKPYKQESVIRDSIDQNLNDVDLAKKKAEKSEITLITKNMELMKKENKELNKQITILKR